MSKDTTVSLVMTISLPAARLAIASSVAVLVLLTGLHALSPEFDPAWRMVSEYANGHYGWVLSLMFAFWAISSFTLAWAIRPQVTTRASQVGLVFLIAAGVGEAMASVFDINNPLHELAAFIGILGLPVAAMLIGVHLSRTRPWSIAKTLLVWTANLPWMSVVLFIATFVLMIATFTLSGAQVDPQTQITVLPPGVIGIVGWANRFLVVVYCLWVMTVAWHAIKVHDA